MYTIQELGNGITYGYVCIDEKDNVMNNNILPENDAQLFADLYNKIDEMQRTIDTYEAEDYNRQQSI